MDDRKEAIERERERLRKQFLRDDISNLRTKWFIDDIISNWLIQMTKTWVSLENINGENKWITSNVWI